MQLGRTHESEFFHWQHLAAWLGGMMCLLVPFVNGDPWLFTDIPMRLGSGNLAYNLIAAVALMAAGGVLGGSWWRLGKWLSGNRDEMMSISVGLLFGLGLWGLNTKMLDNLFPYLLTGLLIVSIAIVYKRRRVKSADWLGWNDFLIWLDKKNHVNLVFFFVLLASLLLNNLALIVAMDASSGEKLSIFVGRLLTHLFLVSATCFFVELSMRSAPKYLRWVPWLVVAIIPLLVVVDQLLGVMWNRTLLDVANALTATGDLDLAVELQTSGLDIGPVGAWLLAAGVLLCAFAVSAACHWISHRCKTRLSLGFFVVLVVFSWLGVLVEQGIGATWKKVTVRQGEQTNFNLHIGMFTPPQGLGSFDVIFHQGQVPATLEIAELDNKPDVFIFMLESVRSDALKPDIAPFMCRFRDLECQEFEGTWAASNATHLSWFSFFHSRAPVFWREALEEIPARDQFHGALALQYMKQAGYEIEARAVCDLSYKDFGFSNFGYEKNLLHVLEQARDGNDLTKLDIADREEVIMNRLVQSVISRPSGGVYITGLDSPHYNYYWHDGFDPPFKDYDQDTQFPMNPSKEEVQRVVNRYWNSVAWVDSQLEQFCKFLKAQGRYDESIIIVTGDHGEEFQEQGSWFHCSSLRPEQVAVPILIKWPVSMGRGEVRKDVNHIDVMPTLMHALGMPPETYQQLAGRNLWDEALIQTSVSSTDYVGKNPETMVLRRDGYEAVFYWERYWESEVPKEIVLKKFTDPDGELVHCLDAVAYAEELKAHFPDAFVRFFKSLEAVTE
jgi:hypothetical protein